MAKAMEYCLSWGVENIKERIYYLAGILREQLSLIDGIMVTDEGVEKCGIVTFTCDYASPAEIKAFLAEHKINVSTSSGSGNLISFRERGLSEVVRASVHYYNTVEEIDRFISVLKERLPET